MRNRLTRSGLAPDPCHRLKPAAIARLALAFAHRRLECRPRLPQRVELGAVAVKAGSLTCVIGGAERRRLGMGGDLDLLAEDVGEALHEPGIGRHAAIDS